MLGTPDYISPEQALGEPATASSDLYSLGVVAHEMITGRKPFDMGSPVATAIAQVNDPPPELPGTVPLDLREVVDACLAKSASDRPADARSVAEATGLPLGSLPGVTAMQATALMPQVTGPSELGPASASESAARRGTRVLPVALPTAGSNSTGAPRRTHRAHRRGGLRLAWLAVPAVALVGLVTWAALALGGATNGPAASPAARPSGSSSPTTTALPGSTPTTTPPSAASATPSSTATTRSAATAVKAATTSKQPAHPGKGHGKGKAK